MKLLLHGALGTKVQVEPLAKEFPGSIAIDLTGHGSHDLPEDLGFDHYIQDIESARQEQKADRLDLFGYSMGGYAALLYASRYPEHIRSVMTLGTKLIWDREGLDRELRMLDPKKMREKVPQFVDRLKQQHGEKWERLVHATARLITGLHERPLLTPEVLQKIQCPVLLCVGDRDRTAVPEHTLQVQQQVARAGTLVLPNTGHPIEAVDRKVLLMHLQVFWMHSEA